MSERIRGQTLRWTFIDGPTAGKTFEHVFTDDGKVTWQMLDGEATADKPKAEHEKTAKPKQAPHAKYEMAQISGDVFAISYLADSGWTLTSVLDFLSGTVVAFASNEQQLLVQHGTFEATRLAA